MYLEQRPHSKAEVDYLFRRGSILVIFLILILNLD